MPLQDLDVPPSRGWVEAPVCHALLGKPLCRGVTWLSLLLKKCLRQHMHTPAAAETVSHGEQMALIMVQLAVWDQIV